MPQDAEFLIGIGSILLLGLATDFLGSSVYLPRVTLLLIFGIVVGDEVLGIIPSSISNRFELITNVALLMVGFLLGGKLTLESIRKAGRQLIWISLSASVGTAIIVMLAMLAVGLTIEIATLLGCVAAATAPAATVDTVLESNSKSTFSQLLLAIVAIDDVLALILFSFGITFVAALDSAQVNLTYLSDVAYEIVGALLIGILIGIPAAYLTGRIRLGQPMLIEALGLIFICGGIAKWLDVSFIIASMTMGVTIANLAKHHEYPFHEIENIEWPFMVLFFILAGATLEFGHLNGLVLIAVVYVLSRISGKLLGAWTGARVSNSGEDVRRWMGIALLPQAGVAIGMALLAANQFPEHRQFILSIVISTTIFFELTGPVCTRIALKRTEHST